MQIGSKRLTASGNIDDGSSPCRVFAVIVKSGATAGSVQLLDNGASGTEYDRYDGRTVINQSIIVSYPGGLLLPHFGYLALDGNTTYAVVIYEREG